MIPKRIKIPLSPLEKDRIVDYLATRGVAVNDFFKLYISHGHYKEVTVAQEMEIEIVTLKDMGFNVPTSSPFIVQRAVEMGYQLPPAHLGFYLRLAFMDQDSSSDVILSRGQSPDGAICLLSEKLEEDIAFPRSVYLRKVDQELWLRAARFDDDYAFSPSTIFAFVISSAN